MGLALCRTDRAGKGKVTLLLSFPASLFFPGVVGKESNIVFNQHSCLKGGLGIFFNRLGYDLRAGPVFVRENRAFPVLT